MDEVVLDKSVVWSIVSITVDIMLAAVVIEDMDEFNTFWASVVSIADVTKLALVSPIVVITSVCLIEMLEVSSELSVEAVNVEDSMEFDIVSKILDEVVAVFDAVTELVFNVDSLYKSVEIFGTIVVVLLLFSVDDNWFSNTSEVVIMPFISLDDVGVKVSMFDTSSDDICNKDFVSVITEDVIVVINTSLASVVLDERLVFCSIMGLVLVSESLLLSDTDVWYLLSVVVDCVDKSLLIILVFFKDNDDGCSVEVKIYSIAEKDVGIIEIVSLVVSTFSDVTLIVSDVLS